MGGDGTPVTRRPSPSPRLSCVFWGGSPTGTLEVVNDFSRTPFLRCTVVKNPSTGQ